MDAVWFGLAQSAAILPGISRSGATILCLLWLGAGRSEAFRFSFLASLPVILTAFVYEAAKGSFGSLDPGILAPSFAAAFLSGLFALWVLRRLVIQGRLHAFGYYCLVIAIIGWFAVYRG